MRWRAQNKDVQKYAFLGVIIEARDHGHIYFVCVKLINKLFLRLV